MKQVLGSCGYGPRSIVSGIGLGMVSDIHRQEKRFCYSVVAQAFPHAESYSVKPLEACSSCGKRPEVYILAKRKKPKETKGHGGC